MKRFVEYIEEAVIIPKKSKKVKDILTKGFREWYHEFLARGNPSPDLEEEYYQLTKKWADGGLRANAIWVVPANTSSEARNMNPIAPMEGIVGATYQPFHNNIKIYVDEKQMMKNLFSGDIAKKWEATFKRLMHSVDHELVHQEQWDRVPKNVRGAALTASGLQRQGWKSTFGKEYFSQPNEVMAYAQDAAKEIIEYAKKKGLDPFEVQKKIQKFITKSGSLFDTKEFPSYAVYLIYGIDDRKLINRFHKAVFQYLEGLAV